MDVLEKWNGIYSTRNSSEPAHVLLDHLHLLPESGQCLDLACGLGANAIVLAQQGLEVQAWDISDVAINRLRDYASTHHLPITARQLDLDQAEFPVENFDVILVSRFLDRSKMAQIKRAVRVGGLIFYQTFTQTKVSEGGPGNPAFLLEPNELLRIFAGFNILSFRDEQRVGKLNQGFRNESFIVARKTKEETL